MSINQPLSICRSRSPCARLAAGVLASTIAMALPAHAAIVTFRPSLQVPADGNGLYVNLLTGASGTTQLSVPGWDFNPYANPFELAFFWNLGVPTAGGTASSVTGPYVEVPYGGVVSSQSIFSSEQGFAQTVNVRSGGTHNVGFRFKNETTGQLNYGVVTYTCSSPSGFPMQITRWSFDNTGAPYTFTDLFLNGFE